MSSTTSRRLPLLLEYLCYFNESHLPYLDNMNVCGKSALRAVLCFRLALEVS
ncbi:hypothetical protein JMJ77_0014061 [Colletotrichum scovillei]|uniref:Uncharacterized protein n=1 Tax=Colletotrichum scovillei TaxID=1209932 RepID=A0A9P7R2N4_9PEZI|nr:hypothetical protein JMJ77_0014061 [Colletotrichum scovillei]KAG7065588.1 hypothetical protein JMJ78_0012336 [Colletotrichum scovillei]KAG7068188.1 hypothetical protein JMJ76_0007879 [Colletotrichum scovillei]